MGVLGLDAGDALAAMFTILMVAIVGISVCSGRGGVGEIYKGWVMGNGADTLCFRAMQTPYHLCTPGGQYL